MSSANPHRSRMVPMSVKNGIASNKSFDKIPKTLSGKLVKKLAGNQPISIAIRPLTSPKADNENATGKPMSMIKIKPANMSGAKSCILIARVFHNGCPFDTGCLTKQCV